MVGELEWDDKLLEVLRSFSGVSMVCARRDGKCCHDFIEPFLESMEGQWYLGRGPKRSLIF
jgi:hypothetical protein